MSNNGEPVGFELAGFEPTVFGLAIIRKSGADQK
jgi:hypothetical protein